MVKNYNMSLPLSLHAPFLQQWIYLLCELEYIKSCPSSSCILLSYSLLPSVTMFSSVPTPPPLFPPHLSQSAMLSPGPLRFPLIFSVLLMLLSSPLLQTMSSNALTPLLSSCLLFSSVTLSSSSWSFWIFSSELTLSTCQKSCGLFRLFITAQTHKKAC